MIVRVCQACGNEYKTFPSIKPKYCSSKCAGMNMRKGEYISCHQCGKAVWCPPSAPQQFCSKSCARTAANLTDKNPSFAHDISGDKNPMYGKGFSGKDNAMYGKRKEQSPRWKGGRKVRADGYVLVVAPDDHPYPADSHPASGLKYILEHRLVMEQHLGRYLKPEEVVHHIDENPQNNRIENLQLFNSQSEHMSVAHKRRKR